jgi:hypothetical protein
LPVPRPAEAGRVKRSGPIAFARAERSPEKAPGSAGGAQHPIRRLGARNHALLGAPPPSAPAAARDLRGAASEDVRRTSRPECSPCRRPCRGEFEAARRLRGPPAGAAAPLAGPSGLCYNSPARLNRESAADGAYFRGPYIRAAGAE